jgi:nucleoid-associated protein YgaU
MINRYIDAEVIENSNSQYDSFFKDRRVNKINHHGTETFTFPTKEELAQLSNTPYIWKSNDKFWKLSNKFYGDPRYWWVISFFNKKPTEMEVNIGDIIYVPFPLEKIVHFIKGR